MKILITAPEEFIPCTEDSPVVGQYYNLEDAIHGTQAQNKAFHALVQEYWKSGVHPKYGGCPFSEFRDYIKRDLGAGFEYYVYATIQGGKPKIEKVKSFDEIPEEVRTDPDLRDMMRGILKSWAQYTKRERKNTIDNLIDDMIANGVQSDKFNEILEGMKND